jgi:hypothetical protein
LQTLQSELTFDEFLNDLEEYGEYTESGLCEILGTDYHYTSYLYTTNIHVGYFLIQLKDCIAYAPFYSIRDGDGYEQIDAYSIRKISEEDIELLIKTKERQKRAENVLDLALESQRLHLLFRESKNGK